MINIDVVAFPRLKYVFEGSGYSSGGGWKCRQLDDRSFMNLSCSYVATKKHGSEESVNFEQSLYGYRGDRIFRILVVVEYS
jgi:hypothetical protein